MLRRTLVKLVGCHSICSWLSLGLAFSVVLSASSSAPAASYYWTGTSNGNWNLVTGLGTTNWSTTTGAINDPGVVPGSADTVNFFAFPSANFNTELGQNFSITGLNFLSGQGSGTNVVVDGAGGFNLTLGSGGISDSQNTGAATISVDVVLGAVQTWNNFSSNPLTVSGVISGAAANNITLGGGGSTVFTSADTYSGSTTVFLGSLSLSGNGSILNTSGLSLGAGTSLTFDNTATNSLNRVGDATTITSMGGFINLLGNSTANSTETVGTLVAASGASYVTVTPGGAQNATLTFGAAGTITSISHTIGGTVTFSPSGTVLAPNQTLINTDVPANAIIGGWATIGTVGSTVSNTLDWATVNGSNQVVPLAASGYQFLTATPAATDNAKADFVNTNAGTGGQVTFPNAGTATVNTLYLTGNSGAGATTNTTSQVEFTAGGTGPLDTNATSSKFVLKIGSGGIISTDAGGTGHYDNKGDISNMAFIGPNCTATADGNHSNFAYQGVITSGFFPTATTAELDVFTSATGNLRIASYIQDPDATHHLSLVKSGPGLLDLGNGNTQNRKENASGSTYTGFTGKVVINEGILLINTAINLGANPAAFTADQVTFNGGELRTFAGLTPNTNGGWSVGTRGGTFSYTGGGTSNIQNHITGVGGFTYYSRAFGGGTNEIINLANGNAAGTGGPNDYQGATNILISLSDGTFGSDANGAHQFGRIAWTQDNQVPAASAMTMNIVDDTPAHIVQPNTLAIPGSGSPGNYICSVDLQGHSDHFGSLAGNISMRNFTGTLTIGANNLSTQYDGTLYGSAGTQNNQATFITTMNVGTGTFNKVGTGTQTITGNLNYSAHGLRGGDEDSRQAGKPDLLTA